MVVSIFRGEWVRLVAADAGTDGRLMEKWSQDSEFRRLFDTMAAQPMGAKAWMEAFAGDMESDPSAAIFGVCTVAEDRRIGFVGLNGMGWTHGNGWLTVAIGEREFWGRGFGSEAVELILHYGFAELNLHRVSLTVFEYNERAIHSYEKRGFVVEGRAREHLNRDRRRWDMLYMGLLKDEWEARR